MLRRLLSKMAGLFVTRQPQTTSVHLEHRTRAQQQAWIDEQYLRGRVTIEQWRFQTDIVSLENEHGEIVLPADSEA